MDGETWQSGVRETWANLANVGIRNVGLWNLDSGTWNLAGDLELGIWNSGFWNWESGTRNLSQVVRSSKAQKFLQGFLNAASLSEFEAEGAGGWGSAGAWGLGLGFHWDARWFHWKRGAGAYGSTGTTERVLGLQFRNSGCSHTVPPLQSRHTCTTSPKPTQADSQGRESEALASPSALY